ncbi:MAG: hypothetical protein GX802_01025 [Clostridiales bacterium]|nr:hypothetical protein [Clostridiales bacterium]
MKLKIGKTIATIRKTLHCVKSFPYTVIVMNITIVNLAIKFTIKYPEGVNRKTNKDVKDNRKLITNETIIQFKLFFAKKKAVIPKKA